MDFREATEEAMRDVLVRAIKQFEVDFEKNKDAKIAVSELLGMMALASMLSCQQCRIEAYEIIRERLNNYSRLFSLGGDKK